MRGATLTAAAGGVAAGLLTYLQRNFDVHHSGSLPVGSRVLIIGGGIAGVTTAYEAGRLGYHVRLVEQSPAVCSPASASWGNAGTLGCSKATTLSMNRVTSGVLESVTADTTVSPGVFFDMATLLDPFFWLWGACYLRSRKAVSQASREAAEHWQELAYASQQSTFALAAAERLTEAADMRIDGRLTLKSATVESGSEAEARAKTAVILAAREPHLTLAEYSAAPRSPAHGVAVTAEVTPQDGQGSCASFCRGLERRAAEAYGARFDTSTSVVALLRDASGHVCGARTASGEEIMADAVVLCTGACTTRLAATMGLYMPIMPLRGYSLTALARDASVRHHVIYQPSSLYVSRLGDELRFTCFGEMTPTQIEGAGPPSEALVVRLKQLVEAHVPNVRELCDWPQAVPWCGARPLTPDCLPLVGRTSVPGLFVNAGHSFNGWRDAALSARILGLSLTCESFDESTRAQLPASGAAGSHSDDAYTRLPPESAVRAYSPCRFQPFASA